MDYLTPKQAAEILGLEVSVVRKYLKQGRFVGAYKIRGTRWLVPSIEVYDMLNKGGVDETRKRD